MTCRTEMLKLRNIFWSVPKGVVARSAFKLEFSKLHIFFCSIVKTKSIGHILERI